MKLYYCRYNNYGNRLIKPVHSRISTYPEGTLLKTLTDYGFNPNDEVNTEVVVNWDLTTTPDYLMVANDDGDILSRWFIMEWQRVRKGQFKAGLRRDVISDNINEIMYADAYIEKGYVNDDSVLVYNSEPFQANVIPYSETPIKDFTGCPWIVAYLNRTDNSGKGEVYSVDFTDSTNIKAAESYTSWDSYTYLNWITHDGTQAVDYVYYNEDPSYNVQYYVNIPQYRYYLNFGLTRNGFTRVAANDFESYVTTTNQTPKKIFDVNDYNILYGRMTSDVTYINHLPRNNIVNLGTYSGASILKAQNNKIIEVGNKNYILKYVEEPYEAKYTFNVNSAGDFGSYFIDAFKKYYDGNYISDNGGVYTVNFTNLKKCRLVAEEYSGTESISYGCTFSYADGNSVKPFTKDAVYEIICAPYANTRISISHEGTSSSNWINHYKGVALSAIQNMVNRSENNKIIDVQILPYCPLPYITKGTYLNARVTDSEDEIIRVSDGSTIPKALFFKVPYASFSTYTTLNIPTNTSNKRGSCLDKFRLLSPNGNGEYEFNAAKLGIPQTGGSQSIRFNINCTYLPVTPYVHIAPDWGGLYGSQNRYAGLILGGDFSLARISNNWVDYQQQNKYYQDIFNRQVETQEISNKYAKINDIAGAISGTISSAVSGAMSGGLLGGSPGAIVGGAVGGLGSAAGGIADVIINDKLRTRQVDDTKFYQDINIKTIQASPTSLARTTAFNIDNSYFPTLIYYTCTFEESNLFDRYIYLMGMTVNSIGNIADYLKYEDVTNIKATLINAPDIKDDGHMYQTINAELNSGVRIDRRIV